MAGYVDESSEGQGGRASDHSWRRALTRQYIPQQQPTRRTPVYVPNSPQINVAFYESVDEEGGVDGAGGGGARGAQAQNNGLAVGRNMAPGDWSSSSDSIISATDKQPPSLPPPRSVSLQRRSTNHSSTSSFTSSGTYSESESDDDQSLINESVSQNGKFSKTSRIKRTNQEEQPHSLTHESAPSTLSSNPTILVSPVNEHQKRALAAKSAKETNKQRQQPIYLSNQQRKQIVSPDARSPNLATSSSTNPSPKYYQPQVSDFQHQIGGAWSNLNPVPEDHLMSFSFATDDGKPTAMEMVKKQFKDKEQFLDSSSFDSSEMDRSFSDNDDTIVSKRTPISYPRSDETFRSVGESHLNKKMKIKPEKISEMPDNTKFGGSSDSLATSAISELLEFDEMSQTQTEEEMDKLGIFGKQIREDEDAFEFARVRDNACYFNDGKTVIDFVLVYESKIKNASKSELKAENRRKVYRLAFERKLEDIGLKLEHQVPEQSNIKDTAVVKIHATWDFLTKLADMTGMRSPLAPNDMEGAGSFTHVVADCLRNTFSCFAIPSSYRIPFKDYFYAKFEKKYENAYHIETKHTFFTPIQRMKLVSYALERITINRMKKSFGLFRRGGAKKMKRGKVVGSLNINNLCSKGIYKAWYPLHDSGLSKEPYENLLPDKLPLRIWLYEFWARYKRCCTPQPLDEIREYFGEEIAMYFAWLGFYTKMLIFPTLLSVSCFAYGFYQMTISHNIVKEICENASNDINTTFDETNNFHLDKFSRMCRACPDETCPFKELDTECTNAKIATVFDNEMTSVYAILMSLWTIIFLELWKRNRSYLAFRWDTFTKDNQQALLRPQYKLKVTSTTVNPATQKVEVRMKTRERVTRLLISLGLCIGFIFLVICVLLGIQIYKLTSSAVYYQLQNPLINKIGASTVASISGSVMNALFIAITNSLWSKMAWKMTEYEVPRTQEEFEKSYIYKVVLFQFINFYGLLLYMTLLKGKLFTTPDEQTTMSTEQCPAAGCLPEIIIQLIIIMTGKQVLNNILEVSLPLIKNFIRRRGLTWKKQTQTSLGSDSENAPVRWEEDLSLAPMTLPVAFGDYLEMIIQYGFMTMFAAAFPPAALFALINNVIEIRLDAQKYLSQNQRYRPRSARDIGPWRNILDVFTKIAIFVNAITLAFTTQFVDRLVYRLIPLTNNVIRTCLETMVTANSENGRGPDRNRLEGYLNWRLTEFNTSWYSKLYKEPTNDSSSSFIQKVVGKISDKLDINITDKVNDLIDTFGHSHDAASPNATALEQFVTRMKKHKNPLTDEEFSLESCYFVGLYQPSSDDNHFNECADFWYVLVAKLAFVVLFEHLVVLCQTIIGLLIPDVPSSVTEHINRERFLQNELFVRHEQEMREKAEKAEQHRKMYPHLAKAAAGVTAPKEAPIRLRGKSKYKNAKGKAGPEKSEKQNGKVGSSINFFNKRKDKIDEINTSQFKRPTIEEPPVRKIRPKGYQERSRFKSNRSKPLLIRIFQKLNYYC